MKNKNKEVAKVHLKFSSKFINIISFILSFLIVVVISFGIKNVKNSISNNSIKMEENKEVISIENNIGNFENDTNNLNVENNTKVLNSNNVENEEDDDIINNEYDWYIEIPKIGLYAPIEEGTDDEILNRSVGHFEDTSRRSGNCGLAAHNRGYKVNYFARIKELKNGDSIFYFVDGKKYEYKINNILIIYETDWSMLEDTEENKLTLITCVENREHYRLCVQGILEDE